MIGFSALCLTLIQIQFQGTVPSKPSGVQEKEPNGIFQNDTRLKAPITVRELEATHVFLWSKCADNARLRIEREQKLAELDHDPVVVYCQGKVWDVMDALAARILTRWEKTPKGYRMLVSRRELDLSYMPKSDKERELNRKGFEMVELRKQLPPEVREQLESGQRVPFDSLSPEMQNLQRDLVRSAIEDLLATAPEGTKASIDPDNLVNTFVQIEKRDTHGFESYWIRLGKPGAGSVSRRVTNYEKRMEEGAIPGSKAGKGEVYTPKKYALSREDALKTPLFKQKITLKMRDVRLPQVLIRLHEKYGLNFVTDSYAQFSKKASVAFERIPMGEAMNRLMELYPKTEWELRKTNMLIFRSPTNPVHDPEVGEDIPLPVQPKPQQ